MGACFFNEGDTEAAKRSILKISSQSRASKVPEVSEIKQERPAKSLGISMKDFCRGVTRFQKILQCECSLRLRSHSKIFCESANARAEVRHTNPLECSGSDCKIFECGKKLAHAKKTVVC